MLDGEPRAGRGLFAPLMRRLEAEQERWFLWMPVLLGVGIGLYFAQPSEPHILTALAPLAVMLALLPAAPRRTGVMLTLAALSAAAMGFALAKMRVEWVRAPVLAKQMSSVGVRGYVELVELKAKRGQRITLRATALGDLPPATRPLPRPRLHRQDDAGGPGRQRGAHARDAHASGRAGAARRLRLRTAGVV